MNSSGMDGNASSEAQLWSHFASWVTLSRMLASVLLAIAADYAWMLYTRWRMVSRKLNITNVAANRMAATRTTSMANMW